MAKDTFVYTVEGEMLTLEQIKARLPNITPFTVRRRVYRGMRTWAELGGCPIKGERENRRNLQDGRYAQLLSPVDRLADEEDFNHGEEFEAILDAIAPDRHMDSLMRDMGFQRGHFPNRFTNQDQYA